MALKIRLARMGRHKRPFYRIVVADIRMPRDGRHCDILGTYNPLVETAAVTLQREKIAMWLERGAELSPTVARLLKKEGLELNKPTNKQAS